MKTYLWMNRSEVEYAPVLIGDHKTLRPAALYLQSFMNLIDSISDGWAYWSYGTRCSADLQDIVHKGTIPCNRYADVCATKAEVTKSCKKIQSFLKRCNQTQNNPTVKQWLADNRI